MKFADLQEGMEIDSAPCVVDAQEMLAFSQRYDPQWFHVNAERAEQGRWQGLIASGWMTCSLAMRMAVDTVLHDSESFASPGLDNLKWLRPVKAGDTLRLRMRVDSKRMSASKPGMGIIGWTWLVFNQDDVQVLEIVATNLFEVGV